MSAIEPLRSDGKSDFGWSAMSGELDRIATYSLATKIRNGHKVSFSRSTWR